MVCSRAYAIGRRSSRQDRERISVMKLQLMRISTDAIDAASPKRAGSKIHATALIGSS
jgi:hypothetical protein